jgi:TolB-like protein/AraC-like DNA-binding protein
MTTGSPGDDRFVEKLNTLIHAKMGEYQFGVSELAKEMGMSRSNLHRRVKETTGKTVTNLISEIRLIKAMEILKEGTLTISEVAYEVGFGSVTYFDKCFHDYFGFSPGETRNREVTAHVENTTSSLTENPAVELSSKRIPWIFSKKALIIIVSSVFILALIIIFVSGIFFNNPDKQAGANRKSLEKSIAVLPFYNDSPDSTDVYLNGVMEGILNNLSKINDLTVTSRTSVEQYRYNKTKATPQIAKELGVRYIVGGSGQKYGDQVRLSIQLIEAGSDKHLFSEQYTRKWEDIFSLQSEIATSVATIIKARITSEEAELIEKKPTENITALNYYLRGVEQGRIAEMGNSEELFHQAVVFFKEAIRLDTTYADPYIQLGWNFVTTSRNYDSALYLANRVLKFDDKNAGAYGLKAWLCTVLGLDKEAEDACKFAIKYNPNSIEGYHFTADLYQRMGKYLQAFEFELKALELAKKHYDFYIVGAFCNDLFPLGLFKEGLKFAEKMIEHEGDSLYYYWGLIMANMSMGNYPEAQKYAMESIR